MDFVYICRDGDNEELRYSIRSVIHSFPESNIWVVGGKPKWYSGNHIEVKQDSFKYKNAVNNLIAICNSEKISDKFILMNDDFFIIKKISNIGVFHGGLLSKKIEEYQILSRSSNYINKLIMTDRKLKKHRIENALDYELHVPMVMQKAALADILLKYPQYLWRSMYGNLVNVGGIEIKDVKIHKTRNSRMSLKDISEDSSFLSTADDSFKFVLENGLQQMFSSKTRFEQD